MYNNKKDMHPYGFTQLPKDTMTLVEYKAFKHELYNTSTIDKLNEVKNKYLYTRAIHIQFLSNLLNNIIINHANSYIQRSYSKKKGYVANENDGKRGASMFNLHITSIIYNHIITLLTIPENNKYIPLLLPHPVNHITKLLLFAHGDYSSMFDRTKSELITLIHDKLTNDYKLTNILL
jgi:hypothetical protein